MVDHMKLSLRMFRRRKRHERDFTNKHLEELAQLANTLELKEYWEFSVEERIFLIVFLSDEVLSYAILRDHLDRCTSVSADLQQKLRSFTSEWKPRELPTSHLRLSSRTTLDRLEMDMPQFLIATPLILLSSLLSS